MQLSDHTKGALIAFVRVALAAVIPVVLAAMSSPTTSLRDVFVAGATALLVSANKWLQLNPAVPGDGFLPTFK